MDDRQVEDRMRRAFTLIADEIVQVRPARRRRGRAVAVAGVMLVAATVVAAITSLTMRNHDEPLPPRDLVAGERALDVIAGTAGASSKAWFPSTLAEGLPNQPIVLSDEVRPASSAVVSGTVVAAAPGTAYHQPEAPDDATPVEVPLDSPDADFYVAEVTIDVDDAVGLDDDVVELGVWLPSSVDPREVAAGLRGLGRVVAVVTDRGTIRVRPDLRRLSGERLLGFVRDGGRVEMPAVTDELPDFLGALDTVAEIMREARRPEKPVVDPARRGGSEPDAEERLDR